MCRKVPTQVLTGHVFRFVAHCCFCFHIPQMTSFRVFSRHRGELSPIFPSGVVVSVSCPCSTRVPGLPPVFFLDAGRGEIIWGHGALDTFPTSFGIAHDCQYHSGLLISQVAGNSHNGLPVFAGVSDFRRWPTFFIEPGSVRIIRLPTTSTIYREFIASHVRKSNDAVGNSGWASFNFHRR